MACGRVNDAARGLARFRQRLALFEAARDAAACSSVLDHMGINAKHPQRPGEPVVHFQRAFARADVRGDAGTCAVPRSKLADPLQLMGRLDAGVLEAAIPQLAASGLRDGDTRAQVMVTTVARRCRHVDRPRRLLANADARRYRARHDGQDRASPAVPDRARPRRQRKRASGQT